MMRRVVAYGVLAAAVIAGSASGTWAAEQGVAGRNLLLQVNKKGKEKLVFLAKDAGIVAPSSPVGALLELCSPNAGVASFDLDASGWSVNKKGIAKFKVKGKPSGVKTALLKPGKTAKIVGADAGLDLSAPLGSVGVRITVGGDTMCALFADSSVKKDQAGKFQGKSAPAPADCSDATLGCASGSASGAFVD